MENKKRNIYYYLILFIFNFAINVQNDN